ncbi:MAG: DUF4411 family protein [Aestuariivita sp.]|nr:DUF4411 family protein [Aestuariivita sp.]MCY4345279.1 DUF4411 family protein [Aestuariivita sp.]
MLPSYPLDLLPKYWEWLLSYAENNAIKVPLEIYEEIEDKKTDLLSGWIKQTDVKKVLQLREEAEPDNLKMVRATYGENLSEVELETIGADLFLISYAVGNPNRVIVTNEISRSRRIRANRTIPDICRDLKIEWMPDITLYRELKISF